MKKNIEHLMQNLPDYITGDLQDDGLRKEISEEININPDFKSEYEDMKSSFAFLGETSLSEPPDFYFNNLLPNINNRLDALESKSESAFSGWFVNLLKFAIPAMILVFGYFLYAEFTGTDEEIMSEDQKNDKKEQIEENHQTPDNNTLTDANDDSIENTHESNNTVPPVRSDKRVSINNVPYTSTDNNKTTELDILSENSDELEEILYDNASFPVASDDIEEQASEELTSQEQDELLNYMANAQL